MAVGDGRALQRLGILIATPAFSAVFLGFIATLRTVIEYALQRSTPLAAAAGYAHSIAYFVLYYSVLVVILSVGRGAGLRDALFWSNVIFLAVPLPPLIDHLMGGATRPYQYAPAAEFVENFLTVFQRHAHASLGQQLRGGLTLVAVTGLVWAARRRVARAGAACLVTYVFANMMSVGWVRPLLPSGSSGLDGAALVTDIVIHQGYSLFYVLLVLSLVSLWRCRRSTASQRWSTGVKLALLVSCALLSLLRTTPALALELLITNAAGVVFAATLVGLVVWVEPAGEGQAALYALLSLVLALSLGIASFATMVGLWLWWASASALGATRPGRFSAVVAAAGLCALICLFGACSYAQDGAVAWWPQLVVLPLALTALGFAGVTRSNEGSGVQDRSAGLERVRTTRRSKVVLVVIGWWALAALAREPADWLVAAVLGAGSVAFLLRGAGTFGHAMLVAVYLSVITMSTALRVTLLTDFIRW